MEKYIHFTNFNIEKIESIFKYGIRTPFNLMINGIKKLEFNDTYNGLFFTSLTKETECTRSIYKSFVASPYYIGIELNIDKVYKANSKLPIFTNTPIPLRYSPYNDEWQTNKTILPENFTAIYYPSIIAEKTYSKEEFTEISEKIIHLKELMKLYNLNIPIIEKKVYTK